MPAAQRHVDVELFEDALRQALGEPEVVRQLASLGADTDYRTQLEAELRRRVHEIRADAATELEQLHAAMEQVQAAVPSTTPAEDERTVVGVLDEIDAALAEQLEEVRAGIAELDEEEARQLKAEREFRLEIEQFRVSKEILKSKVEAGLAQPDDEVSRPTALARLRDMLPFVRPRWSATEMRDISYQHKLEELQAMRKRIGNVVTARKRLDLQLQRLEQTALQDRARREAIDAPTAGSDLVADQARLDTARSSALRALVEKGALPRCRRWLNERLEQRRQDARYGLDLGGATASGLAELQNPQHEVPTTAYLRLSRLLGQMQGGSIGIAGPRGSGKTTLLCSFCRPGSTVAGRTPRAAFVVAAPVRYTPLEFVTHVLEKLCRELLPRNSIIDALDGGNAEELVRMKRRAVGVTAVVTALGGVCAAGGFVVATRSSGATTMDRSTSLLALACALVVCGVLALIRGARGSLIGARARRLATLRPRGFNVSTRAEWVLAGILLLVTAAVIEVGAATGRPAAGLDAGALFMVAGTLFVLATLGVCDRLLEGPAKTARGRSANSLRRDLRQLTAANGRDAALAASVVLLAASIPLFTLSLMDRMSAQRVIVGCGLVAIGLVISYFAVRAGGDARRTIAMRSVRARVEPGGESALILAEDNLRRIRFRQNVSSGWTSKLAIPGAAKLPLSAERSSSGGRSAAEEPVTMPEVVERLRETLTAAALDHPVVVGIDELDKIGSNEDAEQFLNDVKAMFGVPGCYFLISVSEDAVASFERRGMPLRDAFDSAFDDILRVEHFGLGGTLSLLTERTIGMPMPFMALCHILSGGLARDTIRVARRVFDPPEPVASTSMPVLCQAIVAAELAAKRDGATTAVRELAGKVDVSDVLSWLGSAPPTPDVDAMRGHLPPPAPPLERPEAETSLAVRRLVQEFTAYWYFSATVVEFFSKSRTKSELERAEDSLGVDGLEELARARQAFGVESRLAWDRVAAFREAWQLAPLDRAAWATWQDQLDPLPEEVR